MNPADILPFLACLPVAVLLIWAAPKLDGEATRRINKIEDARAEAVAWLQAMGAWQ